LLHAEKSKPVAFTRVPCAEFKVRYGVQNQDNIAISKLHARAWAKNFPGRRSQRKKDRKLAKNTENSTICVFQGGTMEKITEKIVKRPKNTTFKPLYLYHVWKSREGPRPPYRRLWKSRKGPRPPISCRRPWLHVLLFDSNDV